MAGKISVFLSMPKGEIKTDQIVRQAFRDQKQVFVPFITREISMRSGVKNQVMDMVSLDSLKDYEALQPDAWGIPSVKAESIQGRRRCLPVETANGEELDLVVMPGVAFDKGRRRLGHGKGYYDSFLSRYERTFKARDADSAMPFLGMSLTSPNSNPCSI